MIASFSSGMPPTSVYLVLPASMARIAASLMLPGVSKSGSPAPRPMTLRPAAFSARALSVTAIVADGFTRSSAADRKGIIISWQVFLTSSLGKFSWQVLLAHVVNRRNPRLFVMGSLHPKPHPAASQEAWTDRPKL